MRCCPAGLREAGVESLTDVEEEADVQVAKHRTEDRRVGHISTKRNSKDRTDYY